jgi:hypothetical protein
MSILGEAIHRNRRRSAPSPFGDGVVPGSASGPGHAGATPTPALAPAAGPPREDDGRSELARRRDALAEQVTEVHWDLGGLAYEMAIRDHFRLDVLVARAAALQERDAELAEVERLLALEETAIAGACTTCAAPHSRGALYCWQCGATLMSRSSSFTPAAAGIAAGTPAPTAPMDALLADAQRGDEAARSALPPGA